MQDEWCGVKAQQSQSTLNTLCSNLELLEIACTSIMLYPIRWTSAQLFRIMLMIYYRTKIQVYCCCSFRITLIIYFLKVQVKFTHMVHLRLCEKISLRITKNLLGGVNLSSNWVFLGLLIFFTQSDRLTRKNLIEVRIMFFWFSLITLKMP